jgi:ABC-2 type transport system permease protein
MNRMQALQEEGRGMSANPNLVALGTITRREVMRILRIWTQTLLPSAITMTLYFVIFGRMVGSRIGEIAPGIAYIDYIVPGLIMMAVITNSYGNISSSFFGAKFGRHVEEMLASPMPSWVILTGYVVGAMLRGLIVAAIVLAISLFFTRIHLYHPWITLATVLLTSAVFSLAGFVNAIYAKKFDDIALVPTFVLTPLTYLGGVFYSVNALGAPWRELSYANPILYMVNAFRYGLLGLTDVSLGIAFAVMSAFALVLGAIALRLLERGIGLRS